MYDGKPIVPNKGRFVQPYTFSIMHYYYLLTYMQEEKTTSQPFMA